MKHIGRLVAEQAGRRKPRKRRWKLTRLAHQHGDDAVAAIPLAGARDTGKDLAHEFTLIRINGARAAIAAGIAALASSWVAEILKDRRPQARRGVSVLDHASQLPVFELLSARHFRGIEAGRAVPGFVASRTIDQELTSEHVLVVPQERRRRRTPVPTGASALLIVRLH